MTVPRLRLIERPARSVRCTRCTVISVPYDPTEHSLAGLNATLEDVAQRFRQAREGSQRLRAAGRAASPAWTVHRSVLNLASPSRSAGSRGTWSRSTSGATPDSREGATASKHVNLSADAGHEVGCSRV